MSQDYKYANEPLSIIAAMDYFKTHNTPDEAIEKGHSMEKLVSFVEEYHVEKGGLRTADSSTAALKALSNLLQSGHAFALSGGHLILPKNDQRVLGKGKDWVYCYYINSQKKEGDPRFPCTIGRTSGGTLKAVTEYIERQTRKAVVDPPNIPLLFRTDRCVDLEGAIHRILKLRGQQIEEAPRNELFTTNQAEVLEIYDFITHGDQYYTAVREGANESTAKVILERQFKSRSPDNSEDERLKPEKYKNYFQSLIDKLRDEHEFTNARVGIRQNWYKFPSGFTGIGYSVWFRKDDQTVVCVSIDEKKIKKSERLAFFDTLAQHKEEIAAHFNLPLLWERRSEKRHSFITMSRSGNIEASADELDAIRDWHIETLLRFKAVFQPRIEKLLQ